MADGFDPGLDHVSAAEHAELQQARAEFGEGWDIRLHADGSAEAVRRRPGPQPRVLRAMTAEELARILRYF